MKKTKKYKYVEEEIFGSLDKCARQYEDYIRSYAAKTKNSLVLDVGCGLGGYTSLFAINNNRVVGLDVADFRASNFSKKFRFVKYDGVKMPFENCFFDSVVSFDVIEHVEDDLNFAHEIRRVLKHDGKFLITTPNRVRLAAFLLKLAGRPYVFPFVGQESGFGGKSVHVREYTKSDLKSLFQKAGFDAFKIDYFWFGLRGKINIGCKTPIVKSLGQYLLLSNL